MRDEAIVWGVVFGTLAGLVTNSKGRGWGEGIALGGLLGIFGLIVVAFFKPITTPLERPTRQASLARTRLVPRRFARVALVEWFGVDRRFTSPSLPPT